jgi:two-component system LytT family response regulator
VISALNITLNTVNIELVGECAGGMEAVKLIRKSPPDLLFLDIQMPEIDGFTVLRKINAAGIPAIVFVTAYDHYALKAFETHALDYLLKPFSDERFALTLERVKHQLRQRDAAELSRKLQALLTEHTSQLHAPEAEPYVLRFLIKETSRVFFLKVDEINWIEAADYYVNLHTASKTHLLRETMADLETRLDPAKFLRIHRSAIVNLQRVKEVQSRPGGEYFAVMKDGTQLKSSRSRRDQLETLLKHLPLSDAFWGFRRRASRQTPRKSRRLAFFHPNPR